ncbi:hypothetical protein BSKO_03756 [Bryopsis sp. KO-2023]|nr:hypothetical protein BSKO_03756 [Bryopsis sp. KO-2023]
MAEAEVQDHFLPRLGVALKVAIAQPKISTKNFIVVCEEVLPVFDHLGAVFSFAKLEFAAKNASLEKVAPQLATLEEMVAADKMKGVVTQKGSCARNLHRLLSAIIFIQTLIRELARSPDSTLKDAAAAAYNMALAPIHTRIVRGIVGAGLLTLPTKQTFLARIGETQESAENVAKELIPLVDTLVKSIHALYDEPMPASNTWITSY